MRLCVLKRISGIRTFRVMYDVAHLDETISVIRRTTERHVQGYSVVSKDSYRPSFQETRICGRVRRVGVG